MRSDFVFCLGLFQVKEKRREDRSPENKKQWVECHVCLEE